MTDTSTPQPAETPPPPKRPRLYRRMLARLRTYFFAGVLVTAPIGITVWLAWSFIKFIDNTVVPLFPGLYELNNYLPFGIPGLGVVIVLVFLVTVGWFAAGYVGRVFVRIGERLIANMPVIRNVYGALKQILETVLAQQSNAFRQCVLIEYPRRGIWAIGFVTGETKGEVQNLTADTMVNIFLPTTPNPTSGFLLFLPREDLHVLDMSVEEGIKMVVSGGIVTPPDRHPERMPEIPGLHQPEDET